MKRRGGIGSVYIEPATLPHCNPTLLRRPQAGPSLLVVVLSYAGLPYRSVWLAAKRKKPRRAKLKRPGREFYGYIAWGDHYIENA